MRRSESQIQGTSDSCTLSKCSISQRGYNQDPYISCFVNKSPRRAPLINLGYFVRVRAIKDAVESFLEFIGGTSAQIISCGAGFDSNYFVLSGSKKLGPNLVYVEIDYPEVVQKKTDLINNSSTLNALVGTIVSPTSSSGIKGSNYKLIGCDMEKEDELLKCFIVYEIDFLVPTLFISECAITYMKVESSSKLIKWASKNFSNAAFATYEQITPTDGFGIIMINHFQKLNSPLQSIDKYPTLTSQKDRYLELGWSSCKTESIMDIYLQSVSKAEQIKMLSLEPFDEFEEWHSKCCHYSLSIATKGALVKWEPLCKIDEQIQSNPSFPCNWTIIKTDLRRFHHTSCQISRDEFLVIGGFGPHNNGGNARLPGICLVVIDSSQGASSLSQLPVEAPLGVTFSRVHHSCKVMANGKVIIFGGRTSPLNPLSDCLILSICRDDTSNIKCVRVEQLEFPSHVRPPPCWRFSSVIIRRASDEEALMVFGGRGSCSQTLGDLWLLNLKSFTWQKEEQFDGPVPRFGHSAAVWEGGEQVIVSGGLLENGCDYPLNEIWSWHYVSKKWRKFEFGDASSHVPLARYGHGSEVVTDGSGEDLLVMIGGVNGSSRQQPGIGIFNLHKLISVEYSLPLPTPEYPLMTFNHSCHISPDQNEVIILGGGGTCFSFGTSFNSHIIKINIKQLCKISQNLNSLPKEKS
ncbi:tRNA wybutosine-synthesizing protein 4-like [Hetaerina americana]|uniref:tRNA wybutosine-synthesizing protein 4-like n=1 Tax=Hetaerina americana TaxID=62018 RepID=UPI003A7F209C